MRYWITINESGYGCSLWMGFTPPTINEDNGGTWECDYFDGTSEVKLDKGEAMKLVDGPLKNGTITELSINKILPS